MSEALRSSPTVVNVVTVSPPCRVSCINPGRSYFFHDQPELCDAMAKEKQDVKWLM